MATDAAESSQTWRHLPGIRVFFKVDWRTIAPPFLIACWLFMLLMTILVFRPDLVNPARIGTDTSNYYAAGVRLNAGHQLYQLQAGDRPVANGIEPTPWSYPLLSPPPIAVVWRLLAFLFGDASMYLWALAGLLASSVMMAMIIVRCRPGLYPTLLVVMPFVAMQAVSGNVNALLIPACALVWWATTRGRPGVAGALIGLSFALKLTPGLWIWWFIVRRDSRALVTCVATVAAVVAVSFIAVSPDSFIQYLAVARQAGTVGLPGMSPASLATSLGVPVAIANLVPYLLAAGAAALAWLWRDRPAWAFAACAVGVTLGTPDLRFEVLSWLVLVIVPFANDQGPRFWRRPVLLGAGRTTTEGGSPGGI
jgi:hypothetical protein